MRNLLCEPEAWREIAQRIHRRELTLGLRGVALPLCDEIRLAAAAVPIIAPATKRRMLKRVSSYMPEGRVWIYVSEDAECVDWRVLRAEYREVRALAALFLELDARDNP